MLQRWLGVIAVALPVLYSAQVPPTELAPVAWLCSAVSIVGLIAALAEGETR